MLKRFSVVAAALVLVLGASQAKADSYTDVFPGAGAAVVSSTGDLGTAYGYFWSVGRGDMLGQTYTGTPLLSANTLDLDFSIEENFLNTLQNIDWLVQVNGVNVGTWQWLGSDATGPISLHYDFSPINSGSGDWNVAMFVTNEVPDGAGSISINKEGTVTLTDEGPTGPGGPNDVPEPGTLAMLFGAGATGLLIIRRKK